MSGKRETTVLPVRALKCFLGIGGREGGNPFRLIDRTRRVKGNNAVSNHSNSGLCLKISLQVFLSPLPLSSRSSSPFFSFLSSFFLSSLSLTRGHTLQACNYSQHRLYESFGEHNRVPRILLLLKILQLILRKNSYINSCSINR